MEINESFAGKGVGNSCESNSHIATIYSIHIRSGSVSEGDSFFTNQMKDDTIDHG